MHRFRLASAVVIVVAITAPIRALAEVINFEDLPVGTQVKAEYGTRGVTFPVGAYLIADPRAHSGSRVLSSVPPSVEIFDPVPLRMSFPAPRTHIAFFARNLPGATTKGTLVAFGANNAVLAQDGPRVVLDDFTTFFEVRVASPLIVRAEFQIEGSAFEYIDDLVVEGVLSTSFAGATARFSATRREVLVRRTGKMEWATGRGYEADWTVYWSR